MKLLFAEEATLRASNSEDADGIGVNGEDRSPGARATSEVVFAEFNVFYLAMFSGEWATVGIVRERLQ